MNEKNKNIVYDLLAKFGFPIVCCLGLMWYVQETQQQYRQDTLKREDRLYLQIDNFNSTMRDFNNTLISIDSRLQKLEDK